MAGWMKKSHSHTIWLCLFDLFESRLQASGSTCLTVNRQVLFLYAGGAVELGDCNVLRAGQIPALLFYTAFLLRGRP